MVIPSDDDGGGLVVVCSVGCGSIFLLNVVLKWPCIELSEDQQESHGMHDMKFCHKEVIRVSERTL